MSMCVIESCAMSILPPSGMGAPIKWHFWKFGLKGRATPLFPQMRGARCAPAPGAHFGAPLACAPSTLIGTAESSSHHPILHSAKGLHWHFWALKWPWNYRAQWPCPTIRAWWPTPWSYTAWWPAPLSWKFQVTIRHQADYVYMIPLTTASMHIYVHLPRYTYLVELFLVCSINRATQDFLDVACQQATQLLLW